MIHRLKTSALDALYSQDIHSLIPAEWNSGNCDVTLNFYKQTPAVLTCKTCWIRAYWASNSMPGKDRTDILFVGFTLHRVGGLPERQVSTGELEQAHAVVTGCL